MAGSRQERVAVVVVDEWLWGMLVCFTFFSEVVYRSVFLICFEVAVSKHVSLLRYCFNVIVSAGWSMTGR